jgi:hypothetical protein
VTLSLQYGVIARIEIWVAAGTANDPFAMRKSFSQEPCSVQSSSWKINGPTNLSKNRHAGALKSQKNFILKHCKHGLINGLKVRNICECMNL